MRMKQALVAIIVLGLQQAIPARAQLADSEQEFQQMAAALKADDAERLSAITICIEQGVSANPDPAGMAQFTDLPVEQAWEVCARA